MIQKLFEFDSGLEKHEKYFNVSFFEFINKEISKEDPIFVIVSDDI